MKNLSGYTSPEQKTITLKTLNMENTSIPEYTIVDKIYSMKIPNSQNTINQDAGNNIQIEESTFLNRTIQSIRDNEFNQYDRRHCIVSHMIRTRYADGYSGANKANREKLAKDLGINYQKLRPLYIKRTPTPTDKEWAIQTITQFFHQNNIQNIK